ncbi:O-antigen ligase family protein [Candidatus Falkowbacteria bacterium]|nr:O-antigen ligase family protein [Candidatus Falkowbacteria bacterium]
MFRITLLIILALELLSYTLFWLPMAKAIALIILAILVFVLSLINLKYGIWASIIELIIGSKGYLLAAQIGDFTLSLRMAIFCAVILATLIYFLRSFKRFKLLKMLVTPLWITFIVILCWGIGFALWRGNTSGIIFKDFNAYLYFLYLIPFALVFKEQKPLTEFWTVFDASIFALCAKTLILLFTFSHYINFNELYKWVRNTGWGEITLTPGLIRVFSQSHIYALIGFLIFFFLLLNKKYIFSKRALICLCILTLSTTIISLSRSLWAGLIIGIACLLFYNFKKEKSILLLAKNLGILIIFAIVSFGIAWSLINFPYPKKIPSVDLSLSKRIDLQEAAAQTRWAEIKPLAFAIAQHPIVGSGFGTTIKFSTFDPRIQDKTNFTTYAFEWGYLDIILKIGLFGLLIYLLIIFNAAKAIFRQSPELIIGLIGLLATHMFTPYINHPLGIGYLIIIINFKYQMSNQIQSSNDKI